MVSEHALMRIFEYFPGVQKTPVQWEKATPYVKEKYLEKFNEYKNFTTGPEALHSEKMNIEQALKFILGVNKKNCMKYVTIIVCLNCRWLYR